MLARRAIAELALHSFCGDGSGVSTAVGDIKIIGISGDSGAG
jgi:hypothetical protein